MTFGELYTKAMDLWDKSGSPYMPQVQFDTYANLKYNAWVELEGQQVEKNEKYMADLMFLYTTVTVNNTNVIDRVVNTPNFRRRIRFNMTYLDTCTGKPAMSSIDPVTNDEIDVLLNDSLNSPTDEEPLTITTQLTNGNPGFYVYSSTTPLTLNMTYIRNPQVINSATAPNIVFEQPDYIAYVLLQLIVYRLDVTVENLQRAKAEAEDVQANA